MLFAVLLVLFQLALPKAVAQVPEVPKVPEAAEKVEAAQKAAEKAETAEKAAEKAQNAQKAAEKAQAVQKVAEKAQAAQKVAEKAQAAQKAAEKAQAVQKVAEKAQAAQKVAERAQSAQKAAEKAQIAQKAAEKAQKAAEKAQTVQKFAEKAAVAQKAAEKAQAAQKAAEKAGVAQKAAEKAQVAQKAAEKAAVAQKAAEKANVAQKAADKAQVAQKSAEKAQAAQKAAEKASVAQKAAEKAAVAQKAAEKSLVVEKAAAKAQAAQKAAEKAAAAEKSIAAQKAAEKTQAAAKTAAVSKATDKAAVAQKAAEKSVAADKVAVAQQAADKATATQKTPQGGGAAKVAEAKKTPEISVTDKASPAAPTGVDLGRPSAAQKSQASTAAKIAAAEPKDETSSGGKQRVENAGADTRRYKKGEGDQASNEGGEGGSDDQAAPPESVPAAEARAARRKSIAEELSGLIDENLASRLAATASNADDPDAQETANDRIRDIVGAATLMAAAGVAGEKIRIALEQVAKAPDMTYDRVLNRVVGEALIKEYVDDNRLAGKFYDKLPEHAKDKGRDVFKQIIAADAELQHAGVAESRIREVFEKIASSPDDDTRRNEVGATIIKDKYGEDVFDKIPKGKLDRLHDVATQLVEVEAATTLLGGEGPEINAAVSDAAAKGVTTGDQAREVIAASPLYAAASEALAAQLAEVTEPASAPNSGTGNDTAAPAPAAAPGPNPDADNDTSPDANPAPAPGPNPDAGNDTRPDTNPAPGPEPNRDADPGARQGGYTVTTVDEGGKIIEAYTDRATGQVAYTVHTYWADGEVIIETYDAQGNPQSVDRERSIGVSAPGSGVSNTANPDNTNAGGSSTSADDSGGAGNANSSTNSSGGTTSNTNSSGGSTTNTNSGDSSGDSGDAGGDTDTDASTNNTPPPDDTDTDAEGAESRLGPGEREYTGGPSVMGPSFFERLGKAVNDFLSGGAVDPVEHEDNPSFNRNIPVPDAKERLLGDPRVNRALPSGSLQAPGAVDGNVINPDRNDSPAGQPDKTGPVPTPKPLL